MLHAMFLNPTWLVASCFETASGAGLGACRASLDYCVLCYFFRYVLTVVSPSCKHDAGRKVSIQPLLFCYPFYPLILLLQAAMSCAGFYKHVHVHLRCRELNRGFIPLPKNILDADL
jgi:hypothetical protein